MIIVEQPPGQAIEELQRQTGRYVIGHHIALLLRKHGFITHPQQGPRTSHEIRSLRMVPRGAQSAGDSAAAIIEGPVDDAELTVLGLQADRHSAPLALVEGEKLRAIATCYSGFLVKRRVFKDEKQRVELSYADKLHEPSHVPIQAFRSLNAPWRPLLTATWEGSEGSRVVAVEDGSRIVLGLPLFDLIMATQGFWPDLEAGYSSMKKPTFGIGFEAWLVSQIESMLRRSQIMHIRINRWPNGRSWAFMIRHDYDRQITDARLHAICDRYASCGVRSNWFFLPHKLITHQAQVLQSRGHEVALHTTAECREEFRQQTGNLAGVLQRAVAGVTAHGGRYVGFLGGNQYRWAEEAGMTYSEMLGMPSDLPYVGVAARDGASRPLGVVLMPTHASLDAGIKPEQHYLDKCLATLRQRKKTGGCFVLMNHPDIHGPELSRILNDADLSDAWLPTMPEMAAWCRTAHYGARLRYDHGRIQLAFETPVTENVDGQFFNGREYSPFSCTGNEWTMALPRTATN